MKTWYQWTYGWDRGIYFFLWKHTSAEARLTCLVSFSVKCPLLLRFFVCLFWFSVLTQLHYKIHLLTLIKRQHNGFVISEFRVSFNVTTIYITAVPQLHWWHKSPTQHFMNTNKRQLTCPKYCQCLEYYNS